MIIQLKTGEELSFLPQKGVEANKIRALYMAYGMKYGFCRFFRQGELYVSVLDGSVVICGESDDYSELAGFLTVNGFTDIFCCEAVGEKLSELLRISCDKVKLMRFHGCDDGGRPVTEADSLSDVYDIIKEGFDIEFEPWYLDMSHRVRHGISRCYVLDDSAALTVQHEINGEALISQVAVRRSSRGKGIGTALVSAVSSSIHGEVYVICEDRLEAFYKRAGFEAVGRRCLLCASPVKKS